MIGYYIALFALVDAVKQYLKGQGASRGTNRALTFAAAFLFALLIIGVITWGLSRAYSSGLIPPEETAEDYPLVLEDLTDEPLADGDLLMYNANRSLILERIEIQHHGTVIVGGEEQDLGLEYTVTVVKLPALYDWCREQILGGMGTSTSQGTPPPGERRRPMSWQAAGPPGPPAGMSSATRTASWSSSSPGHGPRRSRWPPWGRHSAPDTDMGT